MTPYNFIKQNNLTQKIDQVDYKDVDLFEYLDDDCSEVENLTFESAERKIINSVCDDGFDC
jgi:hypothetical protein